MQLKLEAMSAASPSASDPPSSSPTPPPTEVKADSGHRYSPAFMLATNELFSVSKQISAATAPHVIAFVTYFIAFVRRGRRQIAALGTDHRNWPLFRFICCL